MGSDPVRRSLQWPERGRTPPGGARGRGTRSRSGRDAPADADALVRRGIGHGLEGACDLAVRDFSEVIRLCPDNPWGYVHRGTAYHSLGEYALAVADFTEAIRLDPAGARAH